MDKPLTPLGHLLDQVEELFPASRIDLQAAAKLIQLVDEDRRQQAQPTPEVVRVMRVYVFEGERKAIEEQLARSLGDGTSYVHSRPGDDLRLRGIKIHVATIGAIPQILPMQAAAPTWVGGGAPLAEPLGAHMVYVCRPTWPGNIQGEYDRAVACGATAIVIPGGEGSSASNLYSIEQFRKQWGTMIKAENLPESAAPPEAPPAEIPPSPPPSSPADEGEIL